MARLKFVWRNDVIDSVEVEDETLASRVAFVSIHAPATLAAAHVDVIEDELVIEDAKGRRYTLDVESALPSKRFSMINGYLRAAHQADGTRTRTG